MKYTKYYAILIIVLTSCNVSDSPTDPYPFNIEAFTVDSPTTASYSQGSYTFDLSYDFNAHRIPARRIFFTFTDDSGRALTDATLDWGNPGMWPSNIAVEHIKSYKGVVTITGYIDRPCGLLLDKTVAIQYDSDRKTKHGEPEIILNTKGIAEAVSYIGQCN